MNDYHTPTPPTEPDRIVRTCEGFEAVWRSGGRPLLEDFLRGTDAHERPALIRALLLIELRRRIRRGEGPVSTEYLGRFPDDVGSIESAFSTLASLELSASVTAASAAGSLDPEEPPETELASDLARVSAGEALPPTVHENSDAGAGASAGPADCPEGDPPTIGRYTVLLRLGEGGSGTVYLAKDEDLDRTVAIKVPRRNAFRSTRQIEQFLAEARMVAQLRHPAIVAVHDVGRRLDGSIYIVLEHVDGRPLSEILKAGDFELERLIGLIARVAEAVHHAHKRGLVHRDLKPANILIDSEGSPRVADFGLAVHEDVQRLRLGEVAGTVPYMAPEQVLGETHRLDGRTDIWTLGVILYTILTGRRPFLGDREETFDEILHRDPKPPRQINDAVSAELERICLRCLAKRMTDRYPTAADLAGDLRDWLAAPGPSSAPARGRAGKDARGDDRREAQARVVPRGLRAFDARDADFFLDLLPGPRDRRGLPENLRFWKALIESTNPAKTFRVGLIYGPSGCGKSSLVRAGLLPRLAPHVRSIYVEATPDGTEARLLNAIRANFPGQPGGTDLVTCLAELREGHRLAPGEKVLLVIDQFEQWLHAHRNEQDTEIVAALRHCDAAHLQAIVLVRDDFWMATTRFMRDLEIRLVEGENAATVDLFETAHARHVLTLFGQAFGVLPAKLDDFTADQRAFVEQSVAGLAAESKVIPVRLALFAQMVKGKEWTPATLRAVGGAQGIGVTFLEETFSSPNAPMKHRLGRHASQAVLKALLPESGSDIKGRMRSEHALLEASGHATRVEDFHDLIRTLEGELRLITPTDPAGIDGNGPHDTVEGERYYQLTHDYLVPSLRDWLNRKQRETLRGRAELRLMEHSALWNAGPQKRLLPSLLEWARILLLTHRHDWSEPNRKMMREAGRLHGLRLLGAAVVFIGLAAAGLAIRHRIIEENRSTHAAGLVQQLLKAEIGGVPEIASALKDFRRWTDPELRKILADPTLDPARKLRVGLALLPVDAGQVESLSGRLLEASPAELPVLREALRSHGSALAPGLWARLATARPDDPVVLNLAGSLARFDPAHTNWTTQADKVARAMVGVNPVFLGIWLDALGPAREPLKGPLAAIFRDETRPELERDMAIDILADYAREDGPLLADMMMDATPKEFLTLFPVAGRQASRAIPIWKAEVAKGPTPEGGEPGAEAVKDRSAGRRARAAVALIRLGESATVWPLLRHGADPRVRSGLINRLRPFAADPRILIDELDRLDAEVRPPATASGADAMDAILFDPRVSVRRALILALGTYDAEVFSPETRDRLTARLLDHYEADPDAGIHGASKRALRRWGRGDRLGPADARLRGLERGSRRWFMNGQGQTFVVIGGRGPLDFRMGSPPDEPGRKPHELLHNRLIPRRFAIAAEEVTVAQYREILGERRGAGDLALIEHTPGPDGPRNGITWFEAAEYCNRLSRREGLKEVYEPNERGEFAEGMTIKADALDRTGYRLPTDAEWEYACRAGARTSRYYGNAEEHLGKYAWYDGTSGDRLHPCGELLPNDLGLFDMLGNAYEWCQDLALNYEPDKTGTLVDEVRKAELVLGSNSRLLRGGSFMDRRESSRSADRDRESPANRYMTYGFRPARTLP